MGDNGLDYPANFDVSAFPAGRRIALSRLMAIGTMVVFMIIVCLCALLLWSANSRRMDPFMIAIHPHTGAWTIVGRGGAALDYSVNRTVQESVVGNFVENWLTISATMDENTAAWSKCSRDECTSGNGVLFGTRKCVLYCAANDDVYNRFTYNVADDHAARANAGETWTVDMGTINITPAGEISELGGTFHVDATVISNMTPAFEVEIFVRLARNTDVFPASMGYYVTDFNAYRMN